MDDASIPPTDEPEAHEPAPPAPPMSAPSSQARRVSDRVLFGVCAAAGAVAVVLIGAIGFKVFDGAGQAMSKFGLPFLTGTDWKPNFDVFGAGTFIYGTVVSSATTMLLAVPLGVSIGLFLSISAPRRVAAVIGPLVETLAAIPSVILGFWGILIFGPFLRSDLEPFLHDTLGFIPLFGAPQTTGTGIFNASLILTIMVVPIIASISRDLFLTVPHELQDGATALGSTRWEVVRGVLIPSAASGIVAASFLGLGRALGEAIATSQVLGAGSAIHASLFLPGDTLASRIAGQSQGAVTKLQISALFYLAVILLALGLVANLGAQLIVRRVDVHRAAAR